MVGGFFLVASNELPMCSNFDHEKFKTEWEPFTSRCEIVEMKEKDVKDGTEKFPYTASILAGALKYLTEKEEERSENKHPEEVKQEETYSEAVKAGHMQANFIGEMRSNNSLPMSQPLA